MKFGLKSPALKNPRFAQARRGFFFWFLSVALSTSGCIVGHRQNVVRAPKDLHRAERQIGNQVWMYIGEVPIEGTLGDSNAFKRAHEIRQNKAFGKALRETGLFQIVISSAFPENQPEWDGRYRISGSLSSARRGKLKAERLFSNLFVLSLFTIPSIQDRTITGRFELKDSTGKVLWSKSYSEDVRFVGWLPLIPFFFMPGINGGSVEHRAEINMFRRCADDLAKHSFIEAGADSRISEFLKASTRFLEPATVAKLRELGPISEESKDDYHHFAYDGLDVTAHDIEGKTVVTAIKITSPKWEIGGGFEIGSPFTSALDRLGEPTSREGSRVAFAAPDNVVWITESDGKISAYEHYFNWP